MAKKYFFLVLFLFSCSINDSKSLVNGNASDKVVGGPCDGCELMFVGMPTYISSVDTCTGWFEEGQKLLITGKILQKDGKTPASNIILYYWQTDQEGYYSSDNETPDEVKQHGRMRGWIKTDSSGNYSIYTIRPAPYPNRKMPAHIHPFIKEPGLSKPYYLDDFVFDDDVLLSGNMRKGLENRGGSGVLRLLKRDDLLVGERNIILGLNIPNHPSNTKDDIESGKKIGEDIISFTPYHAWGPDKGTKTCPICKYGRYHGLLYFVGNNPNWESIEKWLTFLEKESLKREKYLKVYFIYGNSKSFNKKERTKRLEKLGKRLNLKSVALTFVPSFSDKASEIHYNKVNPNVNNTIIIYRNRNIVEKFIDMKPSDQNFEKISEALERTKNTFFELKTIYEN